MTILPNFRILMMVATYDFEVASPCISLVVS